MMVCEGRFSPLGGAQERYLALLCPHVWADITSLGIALVAAVLVAWQLGSRDCQQEPARQQPAPGAPPATPAEAQLRKC